MPTNKNHTNQFVNLKMAWACVKEADVLGLIFCSSDGAVESRQDNIKFVQLQGSQFIFCQKSVQSVHDFMYGFP